MNVLSERLGVALKAVGLSAHKFDKKHEGKGVSRATLFNALDGKNFPRFDTIMVICELEPTISAEYLLRGIGEPIKADYEVGNVDPCAKYKDYIIKQSEQNELILKETSQPLS